MGRAKRLIADRLIWGDDRENGALGAYALVVRQTHHEGYCDAYEDLMVSLSNHEFRERYSVPLVLGIRSFARGSISTANRSARASALNALSATWWLLSP